MLFLFPSGIFLGLGCLIGRTHLLSQAFIGCYSLHSESEISFSLCKNCNLSNIFDPLF